MNASVEFKWRKWQGDHYEAHVTLKGKPLGVIALGSVCKAFSGYSWHRGDAAGNERTRDAAIRCVEQTVLKRKGSDAILD